MPDSIGLLQLFPWFETLNQVKIEVPRDVIISIFNIYSYFLYLLDNSYRTNPVDVLLYKFQDDKLIRLPEILVVFVNSSRQAKPNF